MYRGSTRFSTFLVATTLLVAACANGAKDKPAETSPEPSKTKLTEAIPTPAEPRKNLQVEPPKGPTGSIKGLVTITGETPEMPLLRRGSDPACDNGKISAETILVGPAGELANVHVRIKSGSVRPWTPKTSVIVDQKDCMYRPRVQGGVRGQTVEVSNTDSTTHNVHARHLLMGRRQGTETIMNRAQPTGMPMSFELGDEPVAKLKCDYHGWMQGYIVVSDNPYFATTNNAGAYEITDVPAGKHTLEIWHEYYGLKTAEVKVEEDGTTSVDYSYDADSDDPMKTKAPAKRIKKKAGK